MKIFTKIPSSLLYLRKYTLYMAILCRYVRVGNLLGNLAITLPTTFTLTQPIKPDFPNLDDVRMDESQHTRVL